MTDLDVVVENRCRALTAELGAMNSDPYVREAIMKLAIRALSWGLLEDLNPLPDQLADDLSLMADVIREHGQEEGH
ncbi:hypothetical protein [Azospirillum sp. B4]|uniref:hypothetical protein n=1 Tax=Azospirillum sp. B4 TaxID=95605 RepID=UPI0011DDB3BC|nr:hypothetical protein [Azospirillum sp. B4]